MKFNPAVADSPKDYVLQIRIKNGPMLKIMRLNGYKTAASLGRATGISQGVIGLYLGLKAAPLTKQGKWKDSIVTLANFLKVTPDMMFPEQHLAHALGGNAVEIAVSLEEIKLLSGDRHTQSPEQDMIDDEKRETLMAMLDDLPARDCKILYKRFGFNGNPMTLEEIGNDFSVTGQRIREIESRALQRLRKDSSLLK